MFCAIGLVAILVAVVLFIRRQRAYQSAHPERRIEWISRTATLANPLHKKALEALSNDSEYDVRQRAHLRLETHESPRALADIVKNDSYAVERKKAVVKVTDQGVLEACATTDKDNEVRLAAVSRVRNQELLVRIALQDASADVQLAAVEKIDDNITLAKVAKSRAASNCRAVEKIDIWDRNVLEDIAANALAYWVRKIAHKKLGTENCPRALADTAKSDMSFAVRLEAVQQLNDQDLIEEIARSTPSPEVSRAALKKLRNQDTLAEVAEGDKDITIKVTAFLSLTDPERRLAHIVEKLNEINFSRYPHEEELKAIIEECAEAKRQANALLILYALSRISRGYGNDTDAGKVEAAILRVVGRSPRELVSSSREVLAICRNAIAEDRGSDWGSAQLDVVDGTIITADFWRSVHAITETAGDVTNFLSNLYRRLPDQYLKDPLILPPLKQALQDGSRLTERFRLGIPNVIRKTELPEAKSLLLDALKLEFYTDHDPSRPGSLSGVRAAVAANLAAWEALEARAGIEQLTRELSLDFRAARESATYQKNKYYARRDEYLRAVESLRAFNLPRSAFYAADLLDESSSAYAAWLILEDAMKSTLPSIDEETLLKMSSLEDNVVGYVPTGRYAVDCDGDEHALAEKAKFNVEALREIAKQEISRRGG